MAIDTDPFANMPVVAPPTSSFRQKLDEGLDVINEWIKAAADKYIGGAVNACKELGKCGIMDVAKNSASAGDGASFNPSSSPSASPEGRGRSIKSPDLPQLEKSQSQSVASHNGVEIKNIPREECGNLCAPPTPAMAMNRQSLGMAMG